MTTAPASLALRNGLLAALRDELQRFPDYLQQRGHAYHRNGRVGELVFHSGGVEAAVRGTHVYRSKWLLGDRGWRPLCSCPVGPWCKHAHALGLALLASIPAIHEEDPQAIDTLVAGLTERGRAAWTRATPAPVPARPRATGFEPPPPARPTVAQLVRAATRWGRARVLDDMLREAGLGTVRADDPAIAPALDEADPELLPWRVAAAVAARTRGAVPPPLKRYLDRDDLASRFRAARAAGVVAAVRDWYAPPAGHATRTLRVVLDLDEGEEGTTLRAEPRVTSSRLRDVPRNVDQCRTLLSEARRRRGTLSPAHVELLDAVVELLDATEAGGWGGTRSPRGATAEFLARVLPSPDVAWGTRIDPALVRATGIVPGEAVRYDTTRVRFEPSVEPDADRARVGFAVTWPDGRRRTLDTARHVTDPTYAEPGLGVVIADGVVYPVADAPPTWLREQLREPLLLDRASGGELLRTLSRAVPSIAQAASAFARRHALVPVLLLRLDPDDWLQLRLLAAPRDWAPGAAATGVPMFELAASGAWEPFTGAAPAGAVAVEAAAPESAATVEPAAAEPPAAPPVAEPWFDEPEPALVEPAARWLESLAAIPGPRAAMELRAPRAPDVMTGWWVRLTARSVRVLAENWERRPESLRMFGNESMRGLLGAARSFRPRISAKRHGVDLLVRSEWESEQLALSDEDLARLRASSAPWVKLGGGWVRRDTIDALEEDQEWLADLGIEPGMGERSFGLWELAQAKPDSLEALERIGADPATVAAVRAMRERVATFAGLPHIAPPRTLAGTLRPYQQRGLDFLAHVSTLGMGAVLADDMGLGKTIQALAWLLHLRERTPDAGPALVVCPASVVDNWRREAAQFAPGLRVLLLTSGAHRRARMRELDRHDLVVTNYALLRRDAAEWHGAELFAAILDEAQHIKNPAAAVAGAAWGLRATHRLALTGTPLENRALDLWSIMQFVTPGYLGTQRVFTERYDRVDAPPHLRRLLSARLRPVLLRRLKREVAPELPDRIEELRTCDMLPAQKKLYLEELARARRDAETAATQGMREGERRIQVLAALTRLRQICLHPRLAGGHEELGSGKFDALFELLEPLLAEGHKVLLFSQFVKALELVRAEMRTRDIPFHLLTGSTTDRPKVVRAFEQDERACVFLISLKAGGTGLNLTAASYVVLLDPWWNPAVEAQAIDRTHRIGQDRTVIAYRLLMRGTIEEKIWELQQRKGELVGSVLGEDGFARSLDREALEYLFAEV